MPKGMKGYKKVKSYVKTSMAKRTTMSRPVRSMKMAAGRKKSSHGGGKTARSY